MNKKGNWTLEAIFGVVGLGMLIDAFWLKIILPANRFIEGGIGLGLIILAIWIYMKKR